MGSRLSWLQIRERQEFKGRWVALDECRAQGIRPFLLTVDSQGRDYLRTMCNGIDYEVLANVADLPERLATLYGSLTARATVA